MPGWTQISAQTAPTGDRDSALTTTYRLDGEFRDRRAEQAFLVNTWDQVAARSTTVMVGVTLYLASTYVDFLRHGPTQTYFILLGTRLFAFIACLIPYVFTIRETDPRRFYAEATFAQAAIYFSISLVDYLTVAEPVEKLAGFAAIVAICYFGVPNRLILNAACNIVGTLIFILVTVFDGRAESSQIALIVVVLAAINGVGFEYRRSTNRLRREEYTTLQRQKDLNARLQLEVAERELAQKRVASTEASFERIFLAAPTALSIVEFHGRRILQANSAALELFDVPADQFRLLDISSLGFSFAIGKKIVAAVMDNGGSCRMELELKTLKGRPVWINLTAARVTYRGEDSLLLGFHDVTASRNEAEAMRRARDEATAANRSKSEFLANMSHELRTPLNAIIGFSEALEKELFGPLGSPRYREYAEDIHDSGVHLLNLINDILDLSEIEAGHFKLHEEEVDIEEIISSCVRLVRQRALKNNVHLEVEIMPNLPSLMADERSIKQILINLLSNAIKFSHLNGDVKVSARLETDRFRISVADNGIGMAKEDIPRALEPFTQIDGTLSRSHEGTGLGLPLARHLTEMHDGNLVIESVPDEGTTVHIDLPLSRVLTAQPATWNRRADPA